MLRSEEMKEEKGYIHIYTGNGKGKTTAAIGLAVRAAGAGKKTFIAQFVKGMIYSEIKALTAYTPAIETKQYGLECFINRQPRKEDIIAAQKGLKETAQIIESQNYDLVVLDEATIAIYYKLFSVEDLIQLLESKPYKTEIIITGRYAPKELIDLADLVTEMQEVKHYYQQGVLSREGIDC